MSARSREGKVRSAFGRRVALVILFASAPAPSTAGAQIQYPPAPMSAGVVGSCDGGVTWRKDVTDLSPDEWSRLIAAITTLQRRTTTTQRSVYDDLVAFQVDRAPEVLAHAPYLPWHRLYIRELERALQQIDPSVTLPYWNWAFESQAPHLSTIWSDDHLGGNGLSSEGHAVVTGPFAQWMPLIPVPHRLERDWRGGDTIPPLPNTETLNAIAASSFDYSSFRIPLESMASASVHVGVGGDMATFASSNDPLFFMHYAFIDKLWWDWQSSSPSRFYSYDGSNADGSLAQLTDALPGRPDVRVADVIDVSDLCYGYLQKGEEPPDPPDGTPPVITGDVAATRGDNGWYVSDVTVTWSVSDGESDIFGVEGCDPTTIATDTAGVTLTCGASSAGGTASESVTVTRDATSPTVTVAGVADGTVYTAGDAPAPACQTFDATSGVAIAATVEVTGGDADGTGGLIAVCNGATDNAGNTAEAAAVSYTVVPAAWDPAAVYHAGDRVSHDGTVYEASWWTRNYVPGTNPWGPWQEIATDADGIAIWTASRIFTNGDIAIHNAKTYRALYWTRNQAPGDPWGPWEELATAADGTAIWTTSRIFHAGDVVIYQGALYQARWWTRNQAPDAVWGPWRPIGP